MKWYQIPTIGRKWHLLDSKCVNVRSVWGNNEFMEKAHAEAKARAVEAIEIPLWSKVPLPDTVLSRICKNCFKTVNKEY
jgi:hypothetical protein